MQRPATLALTQGFNEGWNSLAIDLFVLILLKSGGGWGHSDQNTIKTIQKAGIGHGVASVVDAGMVDHIAKFSQPSGVGGGSNDLMTLTS